MKAHNYKCLHLKEKQRQLTRFTRRISFVGSGGDWVNCCAFELNTPEAYKIIAPTISAMTNRPIARFVVQYWPICFHLSMLFYFTMLIFSLYMHMPIHEKNCSFTFDFLKKIFTKREREREYILNVFHKHKKNTTELWDIQHSKNFKID